MTISVIKLVNGEEILGSIISDDEYGVRVQDPLLITIERDYKTGLTGLTLLTYIPYSEDKSVLFSKGSVLTTAEIDIYMTEYYEKSLAYNRKHHDKKYKYNINYAISQLDSILESDESSKKKDKSDALSKIIYNNFGNSSNSSSYN